MHQCTASNRPISHTRIVSVSLVRSGALLARRSARAGGSYLRHARRRASVLAGDDLRRSFVGELLDAAPTYPACSSMPACQRHHHATLRPTPRCGAPPYRRATARPLPPPGDGVDIYGWNRCGVPRSGPVCRTGCDRVATGVRLLCSRSRCKPGILKGQLPGYRCSVPADDDRRARDPQVRAGQTVCSSSHSRVASMPKPGAALGIR